MNPSTSRRLIFERARARRLFAARDHHPSARGAPQNPTASPSGVPYPSELNDPRQSDPIGLPEDEFEALVQQLKSKRRVRRVITPSGHRARGRFPSLKTHAARFESLVELHAWRVLEVSCNVRRYQTHPTVFALRTSGDGKVKHYTPDAMVVWKEKALCLEVKGMHWIQKQSSREAIRETLRSVRASGVPLALISETDVRQGGLQAELCELFRLRPSAGLHRQDVDATAWDPLHVQEPNAATLKRWREAQAVCDALLERVMRRDPDDFIQSIPVKH